MKIKTKLIATIMSICLVCAVFAIGVFALKTANLKIGGDVSFSATGVEADIKNVTLTGATNNDQALATGSIKCIINYFCHNTRDCTLGIRLHNWINCHHRSRK